MESLEELQTRHRKEQKDLQARITQKKKGATKKTRKGVNSECEDLERQLKERQEIERGTLNGNTTAEQVEDSESDDSANDVAPPEAAEGIKGVTNTLEKSSISEPASENGQPKKRNRAKERLAKRAAEQEAAVAEAKEEAKSQPDPKAIERKQMLEELSAKGLVEKTIRPDGHCLFSAVADQLSQVGISLDSDREADLKEDQRYKVVRKAAAKYIEGHPDDFAGFLDEPLDQYVTKIRDTAEWGGHFELLALAKTYNVEISVLQTGGSQVIEPGLEGTSEPEKIWLAYYRHGFGLGEHYNSLRKAP
ncbi:Cysteine proteinase [Glarea lozoyensis ATCC 20868]|uniref:Cysteine proteinase n=2 Tax=Glarea lozoyensis TaxID=101852 RepID=S3DAX0_GLAL2|nr:Cysteine proteinase [Glarea lozoyensis ATCC 20868]EPE34855.1 Cysteine proteinase [Glarea lozoyensis ATCC 20868]